MKKLAIAALAGALSVPFMFAQTGTTEKPADTSKPAKASKKTAKKHHAKKSTEKTGTAATTPAPAK